MLSAEAVGLVVKAARGAIKLSRRIDLVRAEQQSVEAPLVLPVPELGLAPTQPEMRRALRGLLQQTDGQDPDPLSQDRADIENAVEVDPDNAVLFGFMQTYLPEQALGRVLDLDSTFMEELRAARPEWAADPDLTVAALYVGAGRDARSKSYTWRLALTVVDTLAEFGADHVATFTRDEALQSVVGSILERFGEADAQSAESTESLVRLALNATIGGVLEARADLDVDHPWLDALLDALARTRASLPEQERDDFIFGLLRGKSYRRLVSSILEESAGLLGDGDQATFTHLATTFLTEIAAIVEREPNFEDFLQDHWGDLLRAGVSSVEKHGPALLSGTSPLLRDVLVGVAGTIARSSDNKILSTDVLVAVVDTVVSVAAAHPEQVDQLIESDWLETLLHSVSATIAREGIRETFTDSGVEKFVKDTLETLANHPELVIDEPGLARELLEGVLISISRVGTFAAERLASAAVSSALIVMADHPEVLKFKYMEMVASLARRIGVMVQERQLTRAQGEEVLNVVIETLAANPALFLDLEKGIAAAVVDAAVRAAEAGNGILSGMTLVDTIQQVAEVMAAAGIAALKNHPAADLAVELENLLKAALTLAEDELGRRMSLRSLPPFLGLLVRAWAHGEITTIDPNDVDFQELFADLIRQEAARQLTPA